MIDLLKYYKNKEYGKQGVSNKTQTYSNTIGDIAMHNIIIVTRYLPSSFFWPNLLKGKRIAEIFVEEMLKKYQGFEGELVSFLNFKTMEIN